MQSAVEQPPHQGLLQQGYPAVKQRHGPIRGGGGLPSFYQMCLGGDLSSIIWAHIQTSIRSAQVEASWQLHCRSGLQILLVKTLITFYFPLSTLTTLAASVHKTPALACTRKFPTKRESSWCYCCCTGTALLCISLLGISHGKPPLIIQPCTPVGGALQGGGGGGRCTAAPPHPLQWRVWASRGRSVELTVQRNKVQLFSSLLFSCPAATQRSRSTSLSFSLPSLYSQSLRLQSRTFFKTEGERSRKTPSCQPHKVSLSSSIVSFLPLNSGYLRNGWTL